MRSRGACPSARRNSSSSARTAWMSIVPDLPCLLVMVCILAKGSGARRLLLNFPDTTYWRFHRCLPAPAKAGLQDGRPDGHCNWCVRRCATVARCASLLLRTIASYRVEIAPASDDLAGLLTAPPLDSALGGPRLVIGEAARPQCFDTRLTPSLARTIAHFRKST